MERTWSLATVPGVASLVDPSDGETLHARVYHLVVVDTVSDRGASLQFQTSSVLRRRVNDGKKESTSTTHEEQEGY